MTRHEIMERLDELVSQYECVIHASDTDKDSLIGITVNLNRAMNDFLAFNGITPSDIYEWSNKKEGA